MLDPPSPGTTRAQGIVQTMLLTKHLLFVGFSLQDPNFSEVAGTVRRARASGSSSNGGGDGFGEFEGFEGIEEGTEGIDAASGRRGSRGASRVGSSGASRGGSSGSDGSGGASAVSSGRVGGSGRGSVGGSGSEPFGTLLTLHNRPFLAELWPELQCVPMDLIDANDRDRVPNPQVRSSGLGAVIALKAV